MDLLTKQAALQRLLETTPGVVYLSHLPDFRLQSISENITSLFGYRVDECLAAEFWIQNIHPDDRFRVRETAAAIERSGNYTLEYRFRHGDGIHRWIRDSAVLCGNAAGGAVEVMGVWSDIASRQAEQLLLDFATHSPRKESLLAIQEAERRRISRELHDNIQQRVAALRFGIGVARASLGTSLEAVDRQLGTLDGAVAEIVEEIHGIVMQLHPAKLDQLGLAGGIEWTCADTAQRSGIEIHFRCACRDIRIHPEAALTAYRVVQECLANIVKHSGARTAVVTLQQEGGFVSLRIEDSGHGFDPSAVSSDRLGIISMGERIRLVGGAFDVRSARGSGTTIQARIPIQPAAGKRVPPRARRAAL